MSVANADISPTMLESSTVRDIPALDIDKCSPADRAEWVTNPPEPPGIWRDLLNSLRDTMFPNPTKLFSPKRNTGIALLGTLLQAVFPILSWGRSYNLAMFKHDIFSGLTLASLCIPQSIGYANLAKLDPQYGLYTSIVPPLVYAVLGTSREIAIGPVAIVSLLLPSLIGKIQDPAADPLAYRNLIFTTTFFAGIFQAAFGFLRLGFLVDFLSHAAIVGFMGGAAIVIGLQQLKGLLGLTHFTNKTDIISVLEAVFGSFRHENTRWNPLNFIIGCSFLSFILITRLLGKKYKKLFGLAVIAPLLSVILSTLLVFLTRADQHGVKIVKRVPAGLNPISTRHLQFHSPQISQITTASLIVAVIALTEAIAVGRSFASMKGYTIDGNREMVALGCMNLAGSLTSCYTATGSFSRTAVNFTAGCQTAVSNIVMAVTVMISLEVLTKLLYFTPNAILASIILSALPGLIDFHQAYNIWKIDKLDFFACLGAFLGVLFLSVEFGLLLSIVISFAKIILISIKPGTEILGKLPGTDTFGDIHQYPMALNTPGVLILRVKSSLLCFANANFIKDRILRMISNEEDASGKRAIQFLVIDLSNLMNIDTSGIGSLEELQNGLGGSGVELAIANPKWEVIHKLRVANFVGKLKGKVFLSVGEAVDACVAAKLGAMI
ncbi:Sulfate transporter 2.1, partial [Cucurbita argyrosperma subsp. sororia]